MTPEERAWLSEHDGKIRLAPDPDARPIDFIDEKGKFQGLALDYVRLIEKRLKFNFNIVHHKTWEEVIRKAKDKEVDVLCTFTKNEQRAQWMLFTEPYIVIPTVILTREEFKGNLTPDTMKDMKVTFTKGWVVDDYLRKNYSHLNMLPAIDSNAAMNNLITHKADAWVTALTVASIKIEEARVSNIRIAGETELSFRLSMASRKDWPVLNNILKKGLALISEKERADIFNKWIQIEQQSIFESKPFWITVFAIMAIAFLPVIIIYSWNKTLKGKVEQKTEALGMELKVRKRAEEELRDSEEKYRTLFETMAQGVVYQDGEGKIISANPSAEKILGLSIAQMQGRTSIDPRWKSIHEDGSDFPGETHPAMISLSTGRKVKDAVMGVFNPQTESYRWISINAVPQFKEGEDSPYQVYTTFDDITERKHAQEALRESEEKYRTILEDMEEGYYEVDLSGNFTFLNDAMCKIRGQSKDELMRTNNRDYMSPETAKAVYKYFNKVYTTGKPAKNMEWETIRADGSKRYIESSVDLMKNPEGQPIGFRGVVRDATEHKRMEAELKQSQKMESIGTLAGGIAHEFNNILGIIIGNTELAIDDVPEWNPAKECLKEIRTASMRAKDVVRHILSFARKTPAQRIPLNISTIIRDSLKLMRSSIPTTIEIRQNIVCESEMILADPTEINQLLMNLCTNAVHALSEEAGVLEVSLESISLDKDSAGQYENLDTGKFVKLTVKDTGQGIDPKIMDRIFDPYFTTKDMDKGTGMGLAVVYGIVKKHDGAIKACSELAKGTVFEVLFPLIEEVAEPELEVEPEVLPTGNESILFVDDERSLVKMGSQMLERFGYQVITKTNPTEALALFKAEPDKFDLVITDMAMPQMAGDRFAQELMQIRKDIPVILCTGHSARINEDRANAMGLAAYVMKPMVTRDFAITVRKVLDEAKNSAQD